MLDFMHGDERGDAAWFRVGSLIRQIHALNTLPLLSHKALERENCTSNIPKDKVFTYLRLVIRGSSTVPLLRRRKCSFHAEVNCLPTASELLPCFIVDSKHWLASEHTQWHVRVSQLPEIGLSCGCAAQPIVCVSERAQPLIPPPS